MNLEWFGDSYDIVKRFINAEMAKAGFRVYADAMPTGDWPDGGEAFLAFIKAEHVKHWVPSESPSALLLDPDTGIGQRKSSRHCTINCIAREAEKFNLVVSFDQSFSRSEPPQAQMKRKLQCLRDTGTYGFYYDSHARFLFSARNWKDLLAARNILLATGLPADRLIVARFAQQGAQADQASPGSLGIV